MAYILPSIECFDAILLSNLKFLGLTMNFTKTSAFLGMSILLLISCEGIGQQKTIENIEMYLGGSMGDYEQFEQKNSYALGDRGTEVLVQYSDQLEFNKIVNLILSNHSYQDTLVVYEYSLREKCLSQGIDRVWLRSTYGYRFERYSDDHVFEVLGVDTAKMTMSYTFNED